MSNVSKLDDHRPHQTKYVACCGCGKDWVATVDARQEGMLECPECGSMAGEVVLPTDIAFVQNFMGPAKSKEDTTRRALVLLNAQRMGL